MSWSSRWRSRACPVEQPRKGYTFMDVDAGGTQQLVAAGRQAGVRRVVYLSGAGAGHDAQRHWFRAKAWRRTPCAAPGWPGPSCDRPGSTALATSRSIASSASRAPCPSSRSRTWVASSWPRSTSATWLAWRPIRSSRRLPIEQVFEVGGPEAMSMREVIGRAMSVAGIHKPLIPGPAPLIKLAAWPMRFLPEPAPQPGRGGLRQPAGDRGHRAPAASHAAHAHATGGRPGHLPWPAALPRPRPSTDSRRVVRTGRLTPAPAAARRCGGREAHPPGDVPAHHGGRCASQPRPRGQPQSARPPLGTGLVARRGAARTDHPVRHPSRPAGPRGGRRRHP